MSLVTVNLKLDGFALNEALRKLSKQSEHLPSYLVNKACNQIAYRAHATMPVVMPGKMDAELSASKLSTKFKPLGTNSMKKGWKFGAAAGGGRGGQAPLLALIINARVLRVDNAARSQPGMSNYNRRTGTVFARESSPFRGKSRKAGAAAMLAAMKRVLSARHSSSGFYRLGAEVIRLIFSKSRSPLVSDGGQAVPGSGKVGKAIGRVAGGSPAQGNSPNARASFWVSTTEPDSRGGTGFERVLKPVWQAAADQEAASIAAYAEGLYVKAIQKSGFAVR